MSKSKLHQKGIVFSTEPDWVNQDEDESTEENVAPKDQLIKIQLDKKHRAGKTATLLMGFQESKESLETLGKELKKSCGTGGSVSGNEILIQGDYRQRILEFLKKKGYSKAKII